MPNFNEGQQRAIDIKGNLLVSASAGTGKTTVMIERIYQMIKRGDVDVSQLLVVTFTNLAAAEMKQRLALKLAEHATDPVIADRLERIDSASISTLHSFCSDVLRNFFYIADIDPSFTVLDDISVLALKKEAMDKVMSTYTNQDVVFSDLYSILASKRQESRFRDVVYQLYEFAETQEDFGKWYDDTRNNYNEVADNGVLAQAINNNIATNLKYYIDLFDRLGEQFSRYGLDKYADVCYANKDVITFNYENLSDNLNAIGRLNKNNIATLRKPTKMPSGIEPDLFLSLLEEGKDAVDGVRKFLEKYMILGARGWENLVKETQQSVVYTDKLVEVMKLFSEQYAQLKKQRGAIDFNDMERMALDVLKDEDALKQLRRKYRYIFVDEYQDTNRVQEAIVTRLLGSDNFFAVGDVKQSIYGFRGCEPQIFVDKYNNFRSNADLGSTVELNVNYRSGLNVLNFVNTVCQRNITEQFGKVNYSRDAMLIGSEKAGESSVEVIVVESPEKEEKEVQGIYDITTDIADEGSDDAQNNVIASKILSLVGSKIAVGDKMLTVGYGDIAILSPSMTDKALALYNCLVRHNIPVVAGFKGEGFSNKEVRDIINFLRVLDNVCEDSCLVGVCLSPIGGLSEEEMAEIVLSADGTEESLFEKIAKYIAAKHDSIAQKASKLLEFIDRMRFYSYSATVDEVMLEVLKQRNWQLYVAGLPNGTLRLHKLYEFIHSVKGCYFAESVSKFVQYIDQTSDLKMEQNVSAANAVRMMTMHASKGLEFPVVILANCEKNFRPESPTLVINADVGMCISNYDFDTMTSNETLGTIATGMYNNIKLKEESMRLLYVAMTRAKHRLIVVSKYSKALFSKRAPVDATSQMEWIVGALQDKYGDLLKDGFSADGITYTQGEMSSVQQSQTQMMCPQDDDLDGALARMSYVYPYSEATHLPSKVASSTLDRPMDDDGVSQYVPTLWGEKRKLLGTAYHMLYQYISLDGSDMEQRLQQLVELGRIDKDTASQIDRTLIENTLNNSQFTRLFQGGKVYREHPFMLNVCGRDIGLDSDETVVLQGVIDLMVVYDDHVNVVDFKYTRNSAAILDNYRAQLESYRLAVKRITRATTVNCYVLSIADNKVVDFQ